MKHDQAEYLDPKYYHSILKEYKFGNVSDLELFKKHLSHKNYNNVLELGCGAGRGTDAFFDKFSCAKLTLLDQSNQMLEYVSKKKYESDVKYERNDHLIFLSTTAQKYDLVYSLWSFSHSIHQVLAKLGLSNGLEKVEQILKKFVSHNLLSNGEMYIMHFDSQSEEQQILIPQWERNYSMFSKKGQSPSKELLDKVIIELDAENIITYEMSHFEGDPIQYKNIDELLEIFLNLHLEGQFNTTDLFEDVVADITARAKKYLLSDGTYSIRPGVYIYKIIKK
jgi:SAM-dependent methyltransferase